MIWNHHASYNYPSELLILLDLALVLAAGALLRWAPGLDAAIGRWLERLALPTARQTATLFALFLLGSVGTALTFAVLGLPEPQIPDEKSYLLAADTFAHGRLSNPPHPMRWHFEAEHVLIEPTYQSKYPPGQGMILAAGQRLAGHPAAGLILSSGLLAAAVAWALAGAVAPTWVAVGGVFVALRIAIGSYWNQGYWGGSVAAIGGALVLGGLLRLRSRPRPWPAAALGAGLVILAISRPYEGLFLAAGAGATLLLLLRRQPARTWARALVPLALTGIAGLAFIAWYNFRVTGDPLLLPHDLYTAQHPDTVLHPELVHFVWEEGPGWVKRALIAWASKVSYGLYFFFGLGTLILILAKARTLAGLGETRIALALMAPVLASHALVRPWHTHYAAPATASAALLMVLAFRGVSSWRLRARPVGRLAVATLVAMQGVIALAQMPAHRADDTDASVHRAEVRRQLEASPGRDLVLIRYIAGRPFDWVSNAADIDRSEIVWADSLGEEEDRELMRYFSDRHAWRLDVDFGPTAPRLIPVRGSPRSAKVD